jgi:hypothetical protein
MLPLLAGVIYLYACANTASVARQHPQEVKGLVNCGECHENQWGALNHKADDFYRKHKFYAGQQKPVCSSCHKESFCGDCHAHKEEIKPGDRNGPSLTAAIIRAGTESKARSIPRPVSNVTEDRTTRGVRHVTDKTT